MESVRCHRSAVWATQYHVCSAPLCCVAAAEEHVSPNFGSKTSTWLNTMRGKNKNMCAVWTDPLKKHVNILRSLRWRSLSCLSATHMYKLSVDFLVCGCERGRRESERERGVFTQLKSCLLSDGRRTDIPNLFVLDNEQLRGLRETADPWDPLSRNCTAKHNLRPRHSGIRISLKRTAASGTAMVTRERATDYITRIFTTEWRLLIWLTA